MPELSYASNILTEEHIYVESDSDANRVSSNATDTDLDCTRRNMPWAPICCEFPTQSPTEEPTAPSSPPTIAPTQSDCMGSDTACDELQSSYECCLEDANCDDSNCSEDGCLECNDDYFVQSERHKCIECDADCLNCVDYDFDDGVSGCTSCSGNLVSTPVDAECSVYVCVR